MPSEHFYRGAKRARTLREELGLGIGPLDDLLLTAETLPGVHVLVLSLGQEISGAYIHRGALRLLLVNGEHGLARQRFTLAHELGHLRMNHSSVVDRPKAYDGYEHDPAEVSANSFAAELLMPALGVKAWGREHLDGRATLEDVVRFATAHGVSPESASYAFAGAGLVEGDHADRVTEEAKEATHVEVAERLGLAWHDDELARIDTLPRIPEALRDNLFCELLAGRVPLDEFAEFLDLTPAQVRAMAEELGISDLLPAA